MEIKDLVRPNIRELEACSSARSLYTKGLLLDANESPYNLFGNGVCLNRYPEGGNISLRGRLARKFRLSLDYCAVGNGSDELLEVMFRVFCTPGKDKVIISSPTYGMYEVLAKIHDVGVVNVPLQDTQLDEDALLQSMNPETKLLFICNPNNPTGNTFSKSKILRIIKASQCIVVIDEAYAEFMSGESYVPYIKKYKNLVVLRTLSKAYSLAGLRLGYLFADPEIIRLVQKVKLPYNVNVLTTEFVLKALDNFEYVKDSVKTIVEQRNYLTQELKKLKSVERVYPSETNFILFRIRHADDVFRELVQEGIIIRSRTSQIENCLRVTVGTEEQNKKFIQALKAIISNAKSTVY